MSAYGELFRIGIVSGKLGGVDGVSLETDKWIAVLQEMGHTIITVAGTYAAPLTSIPQERQIAVPDFRFDGAFQQDVELRAFPHMARHSPHLSGREIEDLIDSIERRGRELGEVLHDIVIEHRIDVLIGQNTNAMPMTILGGAALHWVATTQRVATIFHHHDFWWERSRFSNSRIEPLLNRIMPPVDLGLEHVVISSYAAHILTSLKRVQPHIIPNCEDFDQPVERDEYNAHVREDVGISDDDILIVQPTRIVPRKRIEDSVALVGKLIQRYPELAGRVQYVISLYQGDEPDEDYIEVIRRSAESWGVPLHIISDRVRSVRGTDADGRRIYTNRDILAHADLVTYLPIWEGFGNALLEAVAAKVPVVTSTYLVYRTDIMAAGLDTIEVRDRYAADGTLIIEDETLDQVHHVLQDPQRRREMVERSYERARAEFSMDTLRSRLAHVFEEYRDEIRASRRRVSKSRQRYSV